MRSRKLLALIFSLLAIAPALAGYMTLLGAGVGSIQPVASWVSTTDPTFPSSSLTFSRTSLATLFDSTGKLTYAPNNLALNTATLGTQSVTVQVGVNYLISFASGGGSIALSGAGAGTVTSASPVKITASTTTLTLTVTGTVTNAVVAAVTYETTPRTADQVITTSAAYYGPRIDYDPNTLAVKGLLIEEARTNTTYPSTGALSGGTWTLTSLSYPSTTTGIDGVSGTAAKAVLSAGQQASTAYAISTTTSGTGVISAYAKPAGYNYLVLARGTYASGDYAIFDVNAGAIAVAPTFSGSTAAIKQYGSFWLCELRSTQNTTINAFSVSSAANTSATANGTDGIYITEFQTELGATFGTSRIPTAASSVTRSPDVSQFTGAALTALQGSAGSAITETISLSGTSPASITNLIRGTNSILYRDTTGKTGTTNGTTALLTAAAPTWNAALRNGLAWSGAGRSLVFTGGAVATDANAVSNGGTLYLGSNNGSAVENGWYQSFAIYNQRLPDATLQAKSVVGASYAANDNVNPFAPQFAANDNLPVHWRIAL